MHFDPPKRFFESQFWKISFGKGSRRQKKTFLNRQSTRFLNSNFGFGYPSSPQTHRSAKLGMVKNIFAAFRIPLYMPIFVSNWVGSTWAGPLKIAHSFVFFFFQLFPEFVFPEFVFPEFVTNNNAAGEWQTKLAVSTGKLSTGKLATLF
jgi:hypothetical protein